MSKSKPETLKDWNDLHCKAGLAAVREQILAKLLPALDKHKIALSRTLSIEEASPEKEGADAIDDAPANGGMGDNVVSIQKFSLESIKRRFVFVLGESNVFDEYSKILLKKSAFENYVTKKLAKQWFDLADKRVMQVDAVRRLVNDAKLSKKGSKNELHPTHRYILLDGTRDVWDRQLKKRVSTAAVKERLGDRYSLWQNSPERKVIPADNIVFDPKLPDLGADFVNTFEGLPLKAVDEPIKCQAILEMILFLCNNDQAVAHWVTCWLAYPLQNIGAKMHTALLFHSTKEGSGKSFLFSNVMTRIYGQYGTTVGQNQLESSWTKWQSNKLYVVFEEVVSRDQRYNQVGKIKHMITGKTFQMDAKFVDTWEETNYMNAVFLSNESIPWPISENDRRMMVVWPESKMDKAFAERIANELSNGGAEAFYHYLLHYKLGDFKENSEPLHTEARQWLVEASKPNWQIFLEVWRRGGLDVPFDVVTASDIYAVYEQWCRRGNKHVVNSTLFGLFVKKEIAATVSGIPWYEATMRNRRRSAVFYYPNPPEGVNLTDPKVLGRYVKKFRDAAYWAGYNVEEWKKDGSWVVPND